MIAGGPPSQSAAAGEARERILRAAYELFSRFGFRAVGVDRVVAEAGVAKTTLYRHFRSKDELGVAVLDRRKDLWTHGWLEKEVRKRAETPAAQLLACFNAFDDWFHDADFDGCLFTSFLLEAHDPGSPVGAAGAEGLADVRRLLRDISKEAGARDPVAFARQWQLLLFGALIAAAAGDADAALRAREIGVLLLEGEGLGP
jgi:AcrR family transcriptional regulator